MLPGQNLVGQFEHNDWSFKSSNLHKEQETEAGQREQSEQVRQFILDHCLLDSGQMHRKQVTVRLHSRQRSQSHAVFTGALPKWDRAEKTVLQHPFLFYHH